MYDTPVVCFLVVLFAGIILVMLSRLRQTNVVTVYKYLPRDLDTWLRESPYASVSQNRVFASDDWSTVRALHGEHVASAAATATKPAGIPFASSAERGARGERGERGELGAQGARGVARSGGLFSGMSHSRVPG